MSQFGSPSGQACHLEVGVHGGTLAFLDTLIRSYICVYAEASL